MRICWVAAVTLVAWQGDWHGFQALPNARYLCMQTIRGTPEAGRSTEIIWHAYASREAPESVARFYQADTGAVRDSTGRILRRGNATLSIHAAGAASYPRCGVAADSTERTVIIASRRNG